MTTQITIEDIETLAAQIETDEEARRAKLIRLIRAEARIVARREPTLFARRALEISDEDGHYDNSFPPDVVLKDKSGPSLLCVYEYAYESIATSRGFYHAWRAASTSAGIYLSRDGRFFGAEVTGTGRVGQFAAHPGHCDVMLTVDWSTLDEDDIPTDDLVQVEEHLRRLAFPLSQAAA